MRNVQNGTNSDDLNEFQMKYDRNLTDLSLFFFIFYFLKSFWRTHVLFWGHWYPCFGFLVTSPLGFKARVGSALFAIFCGGECNVHSPRFTSGATLADHLAAGAQPVTSPHACAEVGLGLVSNVQSHEQKVNALPLCQRPGFTECHFGSSL